jgi:hypothetical protein
LTKIVLFNIAEKRIDLRFVFAKALLSILRLDPEIYSIVKDRLTRPGNTRDAC